MVVAIQERRELEELPPIASAEDHLVEAMGWLQRLLAWQIDLTRQTFGDLADDEYRGLYVPDQEADLLAELGFAREIVSTDLAARRAELAETRATLELRAAAAERAGVSLPIRRLTRLFRLSTLEQDVLLLGLAPELDLRFERLFAYVQDDVTRRRPSVDLALRLLCRTPSERIQARPIFSPRSPLVREHLVQIFEDGQRLPPLPGRFLRVDDRIVAELLGQGDALVDAVLAGQVRVSRPTRPLASLVLPPPVLERLERFVEGQRQGIGGQQGGLILALQGSYGSGRRAISEAICTELKRPLLTVLVDRLAASDVDPREGVTRLVREALLRGAAILWQGADRLLNEELPAAPDATGAIGRPAPAGPWRAALLAALRDHRGLSFLPMDTAWEARGALGDAGGRFARIELPSPSYAEREALWRHRLDGAAPGDDVLQAIASTFRLSGGQIRDAVAMAGSLSRSRGEAVAAEDLYVACRAQSSGRLDSLAHKIRPTYGWDDIVLPADHVGQLREITSQVRHRRVVLERWGFDAHLAMGKGLNALFAGPSGTGKTMAAEIVAADLGLELYKVDLSTMVSKYIGETEKNLERIFTAAREANAILFFDEADAIFGKRSEVKDAHDRYANIEVGYLLQKMEEYDGIVILATNLRKNLDDAFARRLHAAIDFPFPEEPDRYRIWTKVFPSAAPLAPDVDLAFLAQRFKLAGGNIRNIALLSAFLAAEANGAIGMIHIMRAIKREYQKLGKLLTEADFGPYFAMVRA